MTRVHDILLSSLAESCRINQYMLTEIMRDVTYENLSDERLIDLIEANKVLYLALENAKIEDTIRKKNGNNV